MSNVVQEYIDYDRLNRRGKHERRYGRVPG